MVERAVRLQRNVPGETWREPCDKGKGGARYALRRLWKWCIYLLNMLISIVVFLFNLNVISPTETEVDSNVWQDSDDLNDLLHYSCLDADDENGGLLSPDTMPLLIYDNIARIRSLANMIILRKLRKETIESFTRSLRVHACTWNVDQYFPQANMPGFGEWLLGKKLMKKMDMYREAKGTADEQQFPADEFPDIIVVSLQEVEMGGVVLVKEYTEVGLTWSEAIVDHLNELGNNIVFYRKLRMVQLVGIVLIVVSRANHVKYIANVRASITRTGAMRGVWGNKGSVGLRATIYGKRFLFIGAHFAAHKSKAKERKVNYHASFGNLCFQMPENVDDASEILDTFNNSNGPETSRIEKKNVWKQLFRGFDTKRLFNMENRVLDRHDYVFFLGDLNSRLHGVESADIRRFIHQGEYDRLIFHDELRQGMISGEMFDGFQEASISFPPTYKYDRGTDIYDTSRKHRDPAWCDRILFRATHPFNLDDCVPLTHTCRPVERAPVQERGSQARLPDGDSALLEAPGHHTLASDVSKTPPASADDMFSSDYVMQGGGGGERAWSSLIGSADSIDSFCVGSDLESTPTFFSNRSSACDDRRFEAFLFAPNKAVATGYQSVPHLRQSDHRPVCGQFDVRVLSLSKELIDEIMQDVRKEIADLRRTSFLSSWTLPPIFSSTSFFTNSNEHGSELVAECDENE